ncbi:hypothetical protein GZ77_13385 [Endozoicomonas montiporae]|uniref:Lipoprotein n=2 Tax=Endozoicomonas montiporae TaxID=1027273 RepID=A0A081N4L6_9GAMM|nr:DUF3833 domain-containing protein [Endozoicomonas montiporae]AMO57746.1 hypothetical protein EZMO1_3797 [Endozoicomonas montiporae CL-33]KEQ13389.1 hypothetical protein GZ77_13385 [Endozoicomonas montiporae]
MTRKFIYQLFGLMSLIWLAGCNTMKPDDYANTTPVLKIEDYFQGHTLAWGMFQDRFGKVRNRFKVEMVGTVKDGVLTLDEDFFYEDGSTSNRLWKIKILGDGLYEGTAGDVIGLAKGKAAGHAFNWTYQMDLPIGDSKWRVTFDDWLFLQEDGVLINVATVTKWGITLGKLTFVFGKKEPLEEAFKP